MITNNDLQKIGTVIDNKLNKALRGVARKKDLRVMESRLIRKINVVADSYDDRIINLERHANFTPRQPVKKSLNYIRKYPFGFFK